MCNIWEVFVYKEDVLDDSREIIQCCVRYLIDIRGAVVFCNFENVWTEEGLYPKYIHLLYITGHLFGFEHKVKGTIPPCSKLFFIPKSYVKRCSTFDWSCWSHFSKKYCVTCKKSTRKVLINFGFVTSFEDSHYTLLFRLHLWCTSYTVIFLLKTPSCQLLFLSMK